MKQLIFCFFLLLSFYPQAQTCFQSDIGNLSIYFCEGNFRLEEDIKFSGTQDFDFGYDSGSEIFQITELERVITIQPEMDGDDVEYSVTFQIVGTEGTFTWFFSVDFLGNYIYDVHFLLDGEMIYLRNNDCPEFVKTEYCSE